MGTSDIYCENCGTSNDLDAPACFICGHMLIRSTDKSVAPVSSGVSQPERGYDAGMTPPLLSGASATAPYASPPQPPQPPQFPPSSTRRNWLVAGWSGVVGLLLFFIIYALLFPIPFLSQPKLSSVSNQTLTIGVGGSTADQVLDPVLPLSLPDLQLVNILYSGLTTVNSQNQIVPGLARSWNAQPNARGDGLDWTFHLQPDLKFSDGSQLTSADIAYTIDRVFSSPSSGYGYLAQYFKDGNDRLKGKQQTLISDSLVVSDPSTLIIKGSGRGVFLPAMMSARCFFVVNKILIAKYGSAFTKHLEQGGTSGLFMQVGHVNATDMELALNPFYYSQRSHNQKSQIGKISVQYFFDGNAERAAYEANRLSIMSGPNYGSLTAEEQNELHISLISVTRYLSMNYLTRPFNNIKIRQAFALAFDKVAEMDSIYKAGSLAMNHIIPQGQPGYNVYLSEPSGVKSPRGDVTLAKGLLQQGMQEEDIQSIEQFPPVTLTYSSNNSVQLQDEMKFIQSQWKNVLGISIKLDDIAGDQFAQKIKGSVNNEHGLQLWFDYWAVDYPDPQNWTTLEFSKGSVLNTMNYGQNTSTDAPAQQQVQSDLLKADAMQDPQQRLDAYQKAEQQLVNDVALLPISQNAIGKLVKPNVHGYQISGNGVATSDTVEAMSIS